MHRSAVTLLITVDTGVSANSEIALARSYGIDVIVLDHHTCPDILPDAIIVHPSLSAPGDIDSPVSLLCGSGIAFTFIHQYEKGDWNGRDIDIALAAIGTVADVVPLLKENRTIVQLGLRAMNERTDHPIFHLARSVVKDGEAITSSHIGYRIAPRINASGRLSDPQIALSALLEGGSALDTLHMLNLERQEETKSMIAFAEKQIDLNLPVLALTSEELHPGIIGLVAGRLSERYGKPSIVGSVNLGIVTCSLRSIPEYHIAEALSACSSSLLSHGGHAAAGGCTLEESRWGDFLSALLRHASETLDGIELVPSITIDAEISEHDLTLELVHSLQSLEPFGEGNREPRFLIQNTEISSVRKVGKDRNHYQCKVNGMKSIGFGLGRILEDLPPSADILCRLGIDSWNGNKEVQIFIEDIRESDDSKRDQKTRMEVVDQSV